jgi:hypothetical protein
MLGKANLLTLFVFMVLGLFFTTPADATTYFVSKSGNDSGTCTESQPCLTINRARTLATQPGDIVQVAPGTYSERLTITASGSASARITFRGHNGSGCPVTPVSDVNHPTGTRPSPTVTVNGFNVRGDFIKIECFRLIGPGDAVEIDVANINDLQVYDNFIDGQNGAVDTGIYLGDNQPYNVMPANVHAARNYMQEVGYGFLMHCRNCLFEENEVFDIRGGEDYARTQGDGNTWLRNYFHGASINNCPGCHIDCWQAFDITGNEQAKNITIDGNVCFNAHESIIHRNTGNGPNHFNWVIKNNLLAYGPDDGHPWAILLENISDVKIYNNTIRAGGIEIRGGSADFRNNILYSMGGTPYRGINGATITANKNLMFQSGTTYNQSSWPNNIVNQNPQFVSESGNNFSLQPSSPARDAGESLPNVATDLTGLSRPQGAAYDIGAYEFSDSSAARPAPPTNLRGTVR